MNFSEAVERFFLSQRGMINDNTVSRYKTTFTQFTNYLDDPKICEITLSDLESWRGSLFDRGLSRYTVDSYIRIIKRFYNWMVHTGIITCEINVTARFQRPKLEDSSPKAVRVEDIKKVLEHMANQERWGLEPQVSIARDRAIILLLADTGCRVGGLCSIKLKHLDLPMRSATVAEKGKGGKHIRSVFYKDMAAAAIKDWLAVHPTEPRTRDTNLFVGIFGRHRGRPLSETGVYQAMKRRAKACNLTGRFNPHGFRHAAAREWLRNGADLGTVSQLLGHSDVSVTVKHYARWAGKELQKRHDEFSYLE
jgi:site-specific recombinase XerD